MPDKGRTMSQTYYERQSKLIELYKESFIRKEMNNDEIVSALKMIGFSENMAASRAREWAILFNNNNNETNKTKNKRANQQVSLEGYILRMSLGKRYNELRSRFINKELSREETIAILMQSGCSLKFSECNAGKWEKRRIGKK